MGNGANHKISNIGGGTSHKMVTAGDGAIYTYTQSYTAGGRRSDLKNTMEKRSERGKMKPAL